MDNLLEAAAIVEQSHGEEEKAKTIDTAHYSVESRQPPIIFFWIALAWQGESQDSDKICTVGKDIEDKEERLEKIWLLISIS